jgi:hypothetical protein
MSAGASSLIGSSPNRAVALLSSHRSFSIVSGSVSC